MDTGDKKWVFSSERKDDRGDEGILLNNGRENANFPHELLFIDIGDLESTFFVLGIFLSPA